VSFSQLKKVLQAGKGHFSPFFMLGDPDPETSFEICAAAVRAGASMLELGIPFSDPVADGPVIQEACSRAMQSGTTVEVAFEIMARLRQCTEIPFNLLLYGNLIHARGIDEFIRRAREAGASSILVPDIPLEEGGTLQEACSAGDMGYVQLCGPGASDDRVRELAAGSSAFLYLVGHQGITGARDSIQRETIEMVKRVTAASPVPVCVGFGLKEPEHVRSILASGARIAIVGSALVEKIDAGKNEDPRAVVAAIEEEVGRLAAAATVVERN
jgi:tryptophan synthase alpha chain